MKRIYTYLLMLSALWLSMGCSDSNNFLYQEGTDVPQLLSYGFFAEDNPDVLTKDYVADLSAGGRGTSTINIQIAMPSTVEKEQLVARFTTSDGTTVKIGEEEQTSRKTVHDFTQPVDYIITKSGRSMRFAVTITKSKNQKWVERATFDKLTTYGDPIMLINPVTNVPYVAFKIRSNNDNRPVVLKLSKDNKWEYVGGEGFGHKISGSNIDFDFATDGTPYVAYGDQEAKTSGALSVQRFDGGSWSFVGDAGIFNGQSNYVSLAVLGNGEIVATQINASRKGDFARSKLVISSYKDGAWKSQVSGLISNDVYVSNGVAGTNAAYVMTINRGKVNDVNYGQGVLKYENGAWTALKENFIQPGNTLNNIAMAGMSVAPDDTPYIWTLDNASGADAMRMEYYDKSAAKWFTLGGNVLPLGFVPGRNTLLDLAVTTDGTPYLVYGNSADQGYPYFMYLDQDTQQWSDPVKLADFKAGSVSIVFSKTGVGYITCTDASGYLHTFIYE